MGAAPIRFSMPQDPVLSASFLTSEVEPELRKGRRFLFFWARNAIFHGLKALEIPKASRILVPAYICRAAVEPICAYGATVDFYDVQPDCAPDWDDLLKRIRPDTKALMAVHYFGFPQHMRTLREICDQHGLKLIEDCAHVFPGRDGDRQKGTVGDISVFSWRKFFPLYDGGELRLNSPAEPFKIQWAAETLLFTAKTAKGVLDSAVDQTGNVLFQSLWRAPSALKHIRRGSAPDNNGNGDHLPAQSIIDSRAVSFQASLVNQPISRVSLWILQHSDGQAVYEKRRHNYRILQAELEQIPGVAPLFPSLPQGICPWIFPVVFHDLPNAHRRLRARGIPAVAWEGVRPPDTHRERFPNSDFLYENLVFLPVHQSLSENHLARIVDVAAGVAREKVPCF